MREMKRGREREMERVVPAESLRGRPPRWIHAWLAFSSLDLCTVGLLLTRCVHSQPPLRIYARTASSMPEREARPSPPHWIGGACREEVRIGREGEGVRGIMC
jgi:hypothetical protein